MQQRERAGQRQAHHPFLQPVKCWDVEAAADGSWAPSGPGLPLWLDTASGEVLTEEPPGAQPAEVQGGLFCDEPGLGKTVTGVRRTQRSHGKPSVCKAVESVFAPRCRRCLCLPSSPPALPARCAVQLGLVLRSLGTLPAAPPGLEPVWVEPRCRGYYSLPQEQAASAAQLTRSRSSGRCTRSSVSAAGGASEPSGSQAAEGDSDPEAPRKRQRCSPSAPPDAAAEAAAAGSEAAGGAAAMDEEAAAAGVEAGEAAGGAAAMEEEAAAAAEEEAAAGEARWAQCDFCEKWRRLPPGSQVRRGHPAASGFASMRYCCAPLVTLVSFLCVLARLFTRLPARMPPCTCRRRLPAPGCAA